ncbi:MAG: c-type cytochrome [Burkholderiales bacterium]|nr:c-type cytochrome [Burkholderiales bacterium]
MKAASVIFASTAFSALLVAAPAHAVLSEEAAEKLMKKDNCASCHTIKKKLIGPAYVDVAAKYKNDKDAIAKLSKSVKEGSTGTWGPIPMPPNTNASADDVKELVTWILTLKK